MRIRFPLVASRHVGRSLLAAVAAAGASVALLPAQGGDGRPLIRWQRTLADALHLAKTKRLPLLVVANQDDEIACEALANDRYRSPDFARLANRYVAVIGSVFRHTPRDHDDQGRRIPCPRFGCVTCGEHIAMEPQLFEKFFKGRRTAPRHIGIGVDGSELFDRFLDSDLRRIDEALRANAPQGGPLPELSAAQRTTAALARSRAQADRTALEQSFLAADRAGRMQILRAVEKSGTDQHETARLALAGDDAALRRAAVAALRATATRDALFVLLRALGTARDDAEHRGLMDALARAAEDDEECRKALVIRRALNAPAGVDPTRWRGLIADAAAAGASDVVPNDELVALEERIEANTKRARRGDPGGKLAFQVAADTFRFALNRVQQQKDPTFLLQDALAAADRAAKAGYPEPGLAAIRARAHWLLNQPEEASRFAAQALIGDQGPGPLAAAPTSATTGKVLEIYARQQLERAAKPADKAADYPVAAIREAHGALATLALHPAGTEGLCEAHIQLLLGLGARRAAGAAIRQAVRRFPTSAKMHEHYRDQVFWEGGPAALARAYETIEADGDARAAVAWFAGYAILIAAEGQVRAGQPAAAAAAYRKSLAAFERAVAANASYHASASHYMALAHGGLARLALDARRFGEAIDAVLAGAKVNTRAFGAEDGLKNTLKRTSGRLRRRVRNSPELKAKLEGGLRELGLLDR